MFRSQLPTSQNYLFSVLFWKWIFFCVVRLTQRNDVVVSDSLAADLILL